MPMTDPPDCLSSFPPTPPPGAAMQAHHPLPWRKLSSLLQTRALARHPPSSRGCAKSLKQCLLRRGRTQSLHTCRVGDDQQLSLNCYDRSSLVWSTIVAMQLCECLCACSCVRVHITTCVCRLCAHRHASTEIEHTLRPAGRVVGEVCPCPPTCTPTRGHGVVAALRLTSCECALSKIFELC
jgi:hypothetical protein